MGSIPMRWRPRLRVKATLAVPLVGGKTTIANCLNQVTQAVNGAALKMLCENFVGSNPTLGTTVVTDLKKLPQLVLLQPTFNYY